VCSFGGRPDLIFKELLYIGAKVLALRQPPYLQGCSQRCENEEAGGLGTGVPSGYRLEPRWGVWDKSPEAD